jgi:nucleoside-diphosphate-sugar epimerase
MKIFVTGGTGALGRRAVPLLVAAGHEVHAVARSPAKADWLSRAGATPLGLDLADGAAIRAAVDRIQPDAITHLATHIPAPSRAILPGAWRQNDRLRRDTSRHLVAAALSCGVARYVQESVTFGYRDGGDHWLDETAPLADGPQERATAASGRQVEAMTRVGRVGILLRFGAFYSEDSDLTRMIVARARAGKPALFGPPGAYLSSLHVEDAASAVVAALDAPPGVYNVVDDEPLTHADHARALARALGLSGVKLLPAAALGISRRARPLTRSQRVANTRLRATTGWRPAYPSAVEGWTAIVAAMAGAPGVG